MSTDGILLLDKPRGITSNAALGRVKRTIGIKKAGHTGTLDPMASGLLVLCFGQATKVAGFLLDADKAYEAEVRLGVTTDSEDAEGEVLERKPVPALDDARIEAVLERFRGPIEQVPPMHSALKHKGQRLYDLARKGEVVERPPRAVEIHELELIDRDEQTLRLKVTCSKGTYIRSLARDIGEALGCGAHLSGLRRTASAPFDIRDSVELEALESLTREQARALLAPPDHALQHLPAVELDEQQASRMAQGQRLAGLRASHSGQVRIYGPAAFMGVGEMDGAGHLKPVRLFATGVM
ncbi:tRNA pseudouridine(55) synthase TruB [Wenzhouxiangella sp. EGI_FJ10409]|uniref:tRNA pseudouridine(55) synthase TruB n=1 Tax=Wenzhouxiangella sp. EGI_FJ10409 TaxID=3243767 RepID=UPI0035DB20F6